MRITTSMVQRNVLSDLNTISDKLNKLQSKAASNKEISRPSDDPFNAARAMALRQSVNGTRQHQKNVEDTAIALLDLLSQWGGAGEIRGEARVLKDSILRQLVVQKLVQLADRHPRKIQRDQAVHE